VVNRYALTQPQRNRAITAAVPHPNNSAKSHKFYASIALFSHWPGIPDSLQLPL